MLLLTPFTGLGEAGEVALRFLCLLTESFSNDGDTSLAYAAVAACSDLAFSQACLVGLAGSLGSRFNAAPLSASSKHTCSDASLWAHNQTHAL